MKKVFVVLCSVLLILLVACEDVEVAEQPVEPEVSDLLVSAFSYEWENLFEMSFYELFADNEPDLLGGFGCVDVWPGYQHPTDNEIILIFYWNVDYINHPISLGLSVNHLMNQPSTSVAELREILGDDLEVVFSHCYGNWIALFNIGDDFNGVAHLENEYDDNITQVIIRQGQRWQPERYEPTLRDFTGHELVGSWQFVASYDIFGVRYDESDQPEESRFLHLVVFNEDGMGYEYSYHNNHQAWFNWNYIDGEIHQTWIVGASTREWTYEINGDVLREIFFTDPANHENVLGAEDLEVFKMIREFVRVD